MSDSLIAFILAAGVGVFVYSKIGSRLGYSNRNSVWGVIAVSFVVSFLAFLVLLKFVIKVH
jgi:hypothetical protein